MTTLQQVLSPTGDSVYYDSSLVSYPNPNVADTFSTVLASKVYGYSLDTLEVASSGKVAFTLGDAHSLDLSASNGDAVVRARNSNNLALRNEAGTASLRIGDGGDVSVEAAPGGAHAHSVGGVEVLRLEGAGATVSNLVVTGSNFRVPVGGLVSRPDGSEGQVFYNTETQRFEGYAAGAWSGLGGTVDVDQDTYVAAEAAPNSDDDQLRFVTAGSERMRITADGRLGYGTSNPVYTIDVIGDLRVSGNIVAGSTSVGDDGGRTMQLGITADGASNIVDGPETNNGVGFVIAGVPDASMFSSKNRERFEKSLRWNYGGNGLIGLGSKDGFAAEAKWTLKGGAFNIANVNADTGAEVGYIMRINEKDEFQFVKHTVPADGTPEDYKVVARFGYTEGPPISSTRGHVAVDAVLTKFVRVEGQPLTVDAKVDSFSAYGDYDVLGALFLLSETPTAEDIQAAVDSGARGMLKANLKKGTDNLLEHTFDRLWTGDPIPDTVLKFAAVTRQASDDQLLSPVTTSFILNDSTEFEETVDAAKTKTSIDYQMSFQQFDLATMSEADKEIFKTWLEGQIVDAAAESGIDVSSVEITLTQGSVKAGVKYVLKSTDQDKLLSKLTNSDSTVVLGSTIKPIPFVDETSATLDAAQITNTILGVERIASSPVLSSVSTVSTGSSHMDFSYLGEFGEGSRMHYLVSERDLGTRVLASTVAAGNTYVPLLDSSGTFRVYLNTGARSFIYFAVYNDANIPSGVSRVVNTPLSLSFPSRVTFDDLQRYAFARSKGDLEVQLKTGITVLSDGTPNATVYLGILKNGEGAPASAAEAYADIISGAHYASGQVSA